MCASIDLSACLDLNLSCLSLTWTLDSIHHDPIHIGTTTNKKWFKLLLLLYDLAVNIRVHVCPGFSDSQTAKSPNGLSQLPMVKKATAPRANLRPARGKQQWNSIAYCWWKKSCTSWWVAYPCLSYYSQCYWTTSSMAIIWLWPNQRRTSLWKNSSFVLIHHGQNYSNMCTSQKKTTHKSPDRPQNGCFQKYWYPKMDGENNGETPMNKWMIWEKNRSRNRMYFGELNIAMVNFQRISSGWG